MLRMTRMVDRMTSVVGRVTRISIVRRADKSAPTSLSNFNRCVEPDTRKGCPYISHGHMKLDGLLRVSGSVC